MDGENTERPTRIVVVERHCRGYKVIGNREFVESDSCGNDEWGRNLMEARARL